MRALFDTNILIDYLLGIRDAKTELGRYDQGLISRISWLEVLVGARDEDESLKLIQFMERFNCVEISEQVGLQAVALRREYKLRLPDALIWSSARVEQALLVTRNTRDFPSDDPGIRVPYSVPPP